MKIRLLLLAVALASVPLFAGSAGALEDLFDLEAEAEWATGWDDLAELDLTQAADGLAVPTAAPAAAAPAGAGGADPLACTGYPEKRTFLESQGWWGPMPTTDTIGHIHVGTCFPQGQTVRGVLNFDVRVILHENPGTANLLRIAIGSNVVSTKSISMKCSGTCTQWYSIPIDTTRGNDGRQELRFTVKVKEPDGKVHYQSTGWQAYFANGKSVSNYRSSDVLIARGWYSSFGYTNATLDALPPATVSGVWRPTVNFKPGSSSSPSYMATIDSDFHVGRAGNVVSQGSGSGSKQLSIDTTKLSNGKHKLSLIAHDKRSGGTNTGVQVVWFVVKN